VTNYSRIETPKATAVVTSQSTA